MNLGNLVTTLLFKQDQAQRQMSAAERQITTLDRNMDTSSRRMSRNWLSFSGSVGSGAGRVTAGFTSVGRAARGMSGLLNTALKGTLILGFVAALAKIPGAAKEAIGNASDVGESLSKNERLFGDQAGTIDRFSRTTASALGLARVESLQFAGSLGNVFRNVGFTTKAAAGMSTQLIGRAADIASFNNAAGGTPEVLQAIQSGLAGETEPLRRFGVFLTADAVQAEALASGVAKANVNIAQVRAAQLKAEGAQRAYNAAVKEHGVNSLQARTAQNALTLAQQGVTKSMRGQKVELTEAQKQQAIYNLVMKQSQFAAGDFARTSGGAANQQRILAAQLRELSTVIGGVLLPIWGLALRGANALVGGLLRMSTVVPNLVRTFQQGFRRAFILDPQTQRTIDTIRVALVNGLNAARRAVGLFGREGRDGMSGYTRAAQTAGRFTGSLLSGILNLATRGARLVQTVRTEVQGLVQNFRIAGAAIQYAFQGNTAFANEGLSMLEGRLGRIASHLVTVATRAGAAGRSIRQSLSSIPPPPPFLNRLIPSQAEIIARAGPAMFSLRRFGVQAQTALRLSPPPFLNRLVPSQAEIRARSGLALVSLRAFGTQARAALERGTTTARTQAPGLFGGIIEGARNLGARILPLLQRAGQAVMGFYTRFVQPAIRGAQAAFSIFWRSIQPAIRDFSVGFQNLGPVVRVTGRFLLGVGQGLADNVLPAIKLGAAVLLPALSLAIQGAAATFRFLTGILGSVFRRLEPFTPVIQKIGRVVGFVFGAVIINALTAGAGAFARIAPLVTRLGARFPLLLRAATPVFRFFQAAFTRLVPWFPRLFNAARTATSGVGRVLGFLFRTGSSIFSGFQRVIFGAVRYIVGRFGLFRSGATTSFNAVRTVVNTVGRFIPDFLRGRITLAGRLWSSGLNTVRSTTDNVLGAVQRVAERVFGFLPNRLREAGGSAVNAARTKFNEVKTAILSPIQAAIKDIGGMPGTLYRSAVSVVNGFMDGVKSRAQALIDTVRVNVVEAVPNFLKERLGIRSPSSLFFGFGSDVLLGFINGITSQARGVIDSIKATITDTIPNFVKNAMGINAPSPVFRSLGSDLILGFIGGIGSQAGAVIDSIKNTITDKLPGFVQKALGIGSPSTLFHSFGSDTMLGFVQGIESQQTRITKAVSRAVGGGIQAAQRTSARSYQEFYRQFETDTVDPVEARILQDFQNRVNRAMQVRDPSRAGTERQLNILGQDFLAIARSLRLDAIDESDQVMRLIRESFGGGFGRETQEDIRRSGQTANQLIRSIQQVTNPLRENVFQGMFGGGGGGGGGAVGGIAAQVGEVTRALQTQAVAVRQVRDARVGEQTVIQQLQRTYTDYSQRIATGQERQKTTQRQLNDLGSRFVNIARTLKLDAIDEADQVAPRLREIIRIRDASNQKEREAALSAAARSGTLRTLIRTEGGLAGAIEAVTRQLGGRVLRLTEEQRVALNYQAVQHAQRTFYRTYSQEQIRTDPLIQRMRERLTVANENLTPQMLRLSLATREGSQHWQVNNDRINRVLGSINGATKETKNLGTATGGLGLVTKDSSQQWQVNNDRIGRVLGTINGATRETKNLGTATGGLTQQLGGETRALSDQQRAAITHLNARKEVQTFYRSHTGEQIRGNENLQRVSAGLERTYNSTIDTLKSLGLTSQNTYGGTIVNRRRVDELARSVNSQAGATRTATAETKEFGRASTGIIRPTENAARTIDRPLRGAVSGYTQDLSTAQKTTGTFGRNVVSDFTSMQEDVSPQTRTLRDVTVGRFQQLQQDTSTQTRNLHDVTVDRFRQTQQDVNPQTRSLHDVTVDRFRQLQRESVRQMEELKRLSTQTATLLRDALSRVFEETSTNTDRQFKKLKTNVTSQMNETKRLSSSTATGLKVSFGETWTELGKNTETKWAGIKKTVTSRMDETKRLSSSTATGLRVSFGETWTALAGNTNTNWAGIKKSVVNASGGLARGTETNVKGANDSVNSFTRNFRGAANFLSRGLGAGIALAREYTPTPITRNTYTALARGTRFWRGGPAIYGEAGQELILHNGQAVLTQGPTLGNLPRGAQVVPARTTERILSAVAQLGGKLGGAAAFSGAAMNSLARRVGFRGRDLITALAVAMGESDWIPSAFNRNNDGSVDRGLWQINSIHGALSTFDPLGNARAAWQISSQGRNWVPWVAYNTGRYRQFLDEATAAALGPHARLPIERGIDVGPGPGLVDRAALDAAIARFNATVNLAGAFRPAGNRLNANARGQLLQFLNRDIGTAPGAVPGGPGAPGGLPLRRPSGVGLYDPGDATFYGIPGGHRGYDLRDANGNRAVFAPRSGTVTRYDPIGVSITSAGGVVDTLWHIINHPAWLRLGAVVRAGQRLGTYAEVGVSNIPHLHWERLIRGILQRTPGAYGLNRPGIALASGGLIREPILGYGLRTGREYSLGESGLEAVFNRAQLGALSQALVGAGGPQVYVENVNINVNGGDPAGVRDGARDGVMDAFRDLENMLAARGRRR